MKIMLSALLMASASAIQHRPSDDSVVMTTLDGMLIGPYVPREIVDEDGDGVEDNVDMDHHELDRFYKPAVYGVSEDIYNTQHGNLPGHRLKVLEDAVPEEPAPLTPWQYEARTVGRLSRLEGGLETEFFRV